MGDRGKRDERDSSFREGERAREVEHELSERRGDKQTDDGGADQKPDRHRTQTCSAVHSADADDRFG